MKLPEPSSLDEVRLRAAITPQTAFRLLGVSKNSGYQAIARREIPSLRIGGRIVVPVPEFLAMLGEHPHGKR